MKTVKDYQFTLMIAYKVIIYSVNKWKLIQANSNHQLILKKLTLMVCLLTLQCLTSMEDQFQLQLQQWSKPHLKINNGLQVWNNQRPLNLKRLQLLLMTHQLLEKKHGTKNNSLDTIKLSSSHPHKRNQTKLRQFSASMVITSTCLSSSMTEVSFKQMLLMDHHMKPSTYKLKAQTNSNLVEK